MVPIKKCLGLLLLTTLVFTVEAQKKDSMVYPRVGFSFSAGIIPVPGLPVSLQPGIELYFSPRFSLLNEISLQTGKHHDFDSSAVNKHYFRYKAEARYYLSAGWRLLTPFVGLQFTTGKRSFDINKADFYHDTFQDDSIYTFDRAHVNSPIKTYTIQIGSLLQLPSKFYLDMSIGFGFRSIHTTYSSVINQQTIHNGGFISIKPIASYRYSGSLTRSQFNYAVRLLYRL